MVAQQERTSRRIANARHEFDPVSAAWRLLFAKMILAVAALASVVTLAAWIFDWPGGRSLAPGLPEMSFDTGVCLGLLSVAGLALTALRPQPHAPIGSSRRMIATIAAASAALIAAMSIPASLTQEPALATLRETLGAIGPADSYRQRPMPPATCLLMLLLGLGTSSVALGARRAGRWMIWTVAALSVLEVGALIVLPAAVRGPLAVSRVAVHTPLLAMGIAASVAMTDLVHGTTRSAEDVEGIRFEIAHARPLVWKVFAIGAIGLFVTALAITDSVTTRRREANAEFDRLVDRLSAEAEFRLNQALSVIQAARGTYTASQKVEAEEFRAYVESAREAITQAGIESIGYIEPASPEIGSGAGAPGYVVRHAVSEEAAESRWRAGAVLDAAGREAAERAIDSGRPVVSTPGVVNGVGHDREMLCLVAVYRRGARLDTPADRRTAAEGLVFASVVVKEAMASAVEAADGLLEFGLFHHADATPGVAVFESHPEARASHPALAPFTSMSRRSLIRVAGEPWTLEARTTPAFAASLESTSLVMLTAGGLLLSVLLAGFAASVLTGRSRAQAIAQRMTADLAASKKAVENALRESQALHRVLNAHSIVSVADRRGRIIQANNAFCQISGYTLEELLGQDHRILNSGAHPKAFWVNIWRSITSGVSWRGEICNRAKDGSLYWVDSIIAPFYGADGRIEKYISIRNDITSRVRNEHAIRESAHRAQLAAEIANLGIWQWHAATGVLHWDAFMFEIYGVPATENGVMDYAQWRSMVLDNDLLDDHALLNDPVATGGRREREFTIRRADGVLRIIRSTEMIVANHLNSEVSVIGVNRDVTEDRNNERRITETLALIEQKNAELSAMADRAHRVVDDVSHEFRTPLAVIKEFASIISDGLGGPITDEQRNYLKIIDGAVIDLNYMVEDLLDSSKLRAGRLRVDRREHRMEDIFATGRPALARKSSSRSITIEERIEPGTPAVFGDEEKVRRVISNLMTNAIKFSPEGGTITLASSYRPEDGEVVVSVTDNGPGLSEHDINRLFGRFSQLSTARDVAAKGFGLGLNIAQELAWLNLGELSVSSQKGHGATFSFTLPIHDPHAILDHYFAALGATDRAPDQLALLRAWERVPGHSDAGEPRSFLASATYAADLILPASAEADAPRAWWILGRTGNPSAWVDRVRSARKELVEQSPLELARIEIEVHQVWNYPEQAHRARAEFEQLLGVSHVNA